MYIYLYSSKYNRIYILYINVFKIMNIKGINRCVLYILQAGELIERRHLFSVYLVHVKLPNIYIQCIYIYP